MNWIAKKSVDNLLVQKYLEEPIKRNQMTNGGVCVKKLEQYILENFNVDENKSVIVVTNGAVALHSLTAGISHYENKRIQWATQSFTFPPSAQSNLSNVKILDIDDDCGIDLKKVDSNITGLIITNVFGNVVDINKYETYCKTNGKFLIFDNAATSYTEYKGKNAINYGHGASISFHHTKPFGFGEGGAIIVDKKYEQSIRCLNNFGIGLTENYWVKEGNNNKMSEISAAYILQYLDVNFKNIINIHNNLYLYFKGQFEKNKSSLKKIRMFPSFHDKTIVVSCICIIFEIYKKDIEQIFLSNNINVRKYYFPLDDSKRANELHDKILCIPCNIDMKYKDIDDIIDILRTYCILS